MARLPALVNALTRTDGRERATLDNTARLIREAGLIATTKRGEGASTMTVRDAANLLIGVNAVQTPRLAAEAVRQFRSLKQTPHGRHHGSGDGAATVFGMLAACDTFGQAVEVLIAEADNLDSVFAAWTRAAFGRGLSGAEPDHRLLGPSLSVSFGDFRRAEIAVDCPGPDGRAVQMLYYRFLVDVTLLDDGQYSGLDDGVDRRVTTTIGMPTLCALHDCIFDVIRDPETDDAGH